MQYIKIPETIIEDKNLNASDVRIYLALKLISVDNEVTVSYGDIGEIAHISTSTVFKCVQNLKKYGYIDYSFGKPNTYYLDKIVEVKYSDFEIWRK